MELRQLRVFVTIAEEQSFTRAADRLHVVQSAVSATLRSLERELGAPLFDRSSHPIMLTDAGDALLGAARRTLADADAAIEAVDQVRGGLRGVVRVGVMQARRGHASVAEVIKAFAAEQPSVQVIIRHTGGSAEMADHVRDGSLDMAFVALTDPKPPGLQLLPLSSEPISLICHREHPLATSSSIRLCDLMGEVFADVPSTWGTRMAVEAAMAPQEISREVRYEVNDIASVLDFVTADLAVALLPASFVTPDLDQRVVALVDAPAFVVSLATPTARPLSAAATALAHTIEAVARAAG